MSAIVRLLFIDDDVGLGRLLKRALSPRGIDVQHVETGDDGLELLAGGGFDVVALDHSLGSETGLDVLPRIAALPESPPVIYVTGSDDARIAVTALKAGAVDYVLKDVQGHYRELLGEAVAAALMQERLKRAAAQAERDIREARDRAELLLREVNHRVANSLSLVASLAHLQASAVGAGEARTVLQEMQVRIAAIAGVHRRLYTSADVRFVDLDSYLESLVEELGAAMSAAQRDHAITLAVDSGLRVATDKAVSLGVIITELVTNAYKYAYSDGVRGTIRVSLRRADEGRLLLRVDDDGVGWNGEGPVRGSGLGSRVVKAMAANLKSTVRYELCNPGTCASMDFAI
jgi:two-component sensor histidine kinase